MSYDPDRKILCDEISVLWNQYNALAQKNGFTELYDPTGIRRKIVKAKLNAVEELAKILKD